MLESVLHYHWKCCFLWKPSKFYCHALVHKTNKLFSTFIRVFAKWEKLKALILKILATKTLLCLEYMYDNANCLFAYLQHRALKSLFAHAINRYRAVFKWLSKVITWLRLPRLVIGSKNSRQFSTNDKQNQKQSHQSCDFSRALRVIGRKCDWFVSLFTPVGIVRNNCFGNGF